MRQDPRIRYALQSSNGRLGMVKKAESIQANFCCASRTIAKASRAPQRTSIPQQAIKEGRWSKAGGEQRLVGQDAGPPPNAAKQILRLAPGKSAPIEFFRGATIRCAAFPSKPNPSLALENSPEKTTELARFEHLRCFDMGSSRFRRARKFPFIASV